MTDDADRYWMSGATGTGSKPDPFGPLMHVPDGALRRVVALGNGETRGTRRVEVLSIEIYETGAILVFRTVDDTEGDLIRFVDDMPQGTNWRCELADTEGTRYQTVAGGAGQSRLWRGEVYIYPAPPQTIRTISIALVPGNRLEDRWAFELEL
jgi:hypothetical protein